MDKRETGGNSTVMERECLKKLLMRLKDKLRIVELTTDASSTIIKMVRDLRGKLINNSSFNKSCPVCV